jgi:hypothetical protein
MASKERNDDELVAAAMAAWYRAGGRDHPNLGSEVVERRGLRYVVLWGGAWGQPEALAVYRVGPDGILHRMRQPPADIWDTTARVPSKPK